MEQIIDHNAIYGSPFKSKLTNLSQNYLESHKSTIQLVGRQKLALIQLVRNLFDCRLNFNALIQNISKFMILNLKHLSKKNYNIYYNVFNLFKK